MVSKKGPLGPYEFADVALGSRSLVDRWDGLTQHNPAVQRAPDGTWLLYYMGSTDSPNASSTTGKVRVKSCTKYPHTNISVCRQRVATAKSPDGPGDQSGKIHKHHNLIGRMSLREVYWLCVYRRGPYRDMGRSVHHQPHTCMCFPMDLSCCSTKHAAKKTRGR